MNRRQFTFAGLCSVAALTHLDQEAGATLAHLDSATLHEAPTPPAFDAKARPPLAQRTFVSDAVEQTIAQIKKEIRNPQLQILFENCYPNTLDTTVQFSNRNGLPDTFVLTGDIAAMWLRDSSAQMLTYARLIVKDEKLRLLFEGLMHRQAECILLDSYANAFYADSHRGEFATDLTAMRPGVHERKWEIDSLCYPIRVASLYWRETGDTTPFDERWHQAARRIVATFREQQRLEGDGPYRFQRMTTMFYDNSPNQGLGNPTRKTGLIHSAFRPSDDACLFPFLIPSNLFAAHSLHQLQEISAVIWKDAQLAHEALQLAEELEHALEQYATVEHPRYGRIYAYEVDGFGNALLIDDANVPSLLSLPYLGCCKPDDPLYQRTRAFVLSQDNPYFSTGVAEGVGGPHVGPGMIWPLSIIVRALTSNNEQEIEACLRMILKTTGGCTFMHESFDAHDPRKFTRPWFAWCNSLFGELIVQIATTHPGILARV